MTADPAPTPTLPPSTLGTRRRPYFAGLDGLRAMAVVVVIVYHLFPGILPGGFLGVDIFFVISGFLITSLLVHERGSTGKINLPNFWQRRARRLIPALVTLVLVCCTAAWMIGGDVLVGLGRQVLGAMTFSNNWFDIAAGSNYFTQDVPELFRNLWSLAVEEQFYLIWPLAILLLMMLRITSIRVLIVVALAGASGIMMSILFTPGADATRVYFGTGTHSFGLMVGAALALIVSRIKPVDLDWGETHTQEFVRRWLPPLGLLSLMLVLVASWWIHDGATFTYRGGLVLVSVVTAVLIWSAVSPGSTLGRALDNKPMRYIGQRSYGLYLWHWPVFILVSTTWPAGERSFTHYTLVGCVSLAITLVAALASYRWIEQPVRRIGFRGLYRAIRTRVRHRHPQRQLAFSAFAVVALTLVGTGAALATAPSQTSAQEVIERGQRAIDNARPSPTHGTSATPTAPASTGATDDTTGSAPASTQAHKPLPAGYQMSAVGDSVMLASAPELQATFPGISIDAVVSRQMQQAPEILCKMAADGTLREVVIVGLGTNGPISTDTLRNIRSIIGAKRELVLITVQAPRDWTAAVNQTLRRYAGDNRRTVALADWQAAIAPHLGILAEDHIHPGDSGGSIYAKTVQNALQRLVDLPPIKHLSARAIGPTAQ